MSLVLNFVIDFDKNAKSNDALEEISNSCFEMMIEACKRKLALNKIIFRDCTYDDILKDNQMLLEISNSFIFCNVFCNVEEILRDDFTIPNKPHIERLKNLQDFLDFILKISLIKKITVFMGDDGNFDYEFINCNLDDFAKVMSEKLFQKMFFAYKCEFVK